MAAELELALNELWSVSNFASWSITRASPPPESTDAGCGIR
jgi:hypothetical protein